MAQHDQLGLSCGARRHNHEGHFIGLSLPELFLKELRLLFFQFFAQFKELPEADEPGVVPITSHTRGIDIDKALDMGEFISAGEELVHLFLVLGKDIGRLKTVEPPNLFFCHGRSE